MRAHPDELATLPLADTAHLRELPGIVDRRAPRLEEIGAERDHDLRIREIVHGHGVHEVKVGNLDVLYAE